MDLHGREKIHVLYELQGIALHQSNEPEPEGRGLQRVLVEHEKHAWWLDGDDGKAFHEIQGKKYMNCIS